MSSTPGDRVAELTSEAADLPFGDVKVSLMEQAVKHADLARDKDLMFSARMDLVNAAIFSGHHDSAMTAFAWCLAVFEDDSQRFADQEYTVLWQFKNILLSAFRFPQISRGQFEKLRLQMTALYRRHGYNLRAVHFARMTFAMANGDRATAKDAFAAFESEPRDGMAHCLACEADSRAEYFDFIDQPRKSIDAARKILNGSLTCTEVPHVTYSVVLRPLALLRRYDEADEYQAKGYKLIRGNPAFLVQIALQIEYLLHRSRLVAAARMLERHLAWALDTRELYNRYRLYLAARLLLDALAQSGSKLQLKLPSQIPISGHGPADRSRAFASWIDQELRELGARFDERNGSHYMTKELVARRRY